jgi:hypothetical protein
MNQPFPEMYAKEMDKIILLNLLSHEYIEDSTRLKRGLDGLVGELFTDIKLFFVDEKKGYCILNNLNQLRFERITRGHPRFRVIF